MKTFVPPIVFRNTQALDRGGDRASARLSPQGSCVDQVIDSLIDRECGVHELERLGA
jgi:hypothetical protein